MNTTSKEVINEMGQSVMIDIIGQFKIDEVDREYVFYTLNDDGTSEDVIILIAQIVMEDGKAKIISIPEKEKNMVIAFFNNMKDSICEG